MILLTFTSIRILHAGQLGEFELHFVEPDQQPIPVRLRLRSPSGKPYRPQGSVNWSDHFVADGSVALKLAPGIYRFTAERGPEYPKVHGSFEIQSSANDQRTIVMDRFVDMSEHGWWSADLFTRRRSADLPSAMAADDLHVAATSDFSDTDHRPLPPALDRNRQNTRLLRNAVIGSGGDRLALLDGPEAVRVGSNHSSSGQALVDAKKSGLRHATAVDVTSMDLPMWLASRRLDSVVVLGPSLTERGADIPRQGNWPGDKRPTDLRAFGTWCAELYYRLLNTGYRIPPIAGSGSGINQNPVGYNRCYVYLPSEFTLERFWEALAAGRVLVTNGPLMVPLVNGEPPGHVFRAPTGQKITLQPTLTLYTQDKIEYLEVIRNGRVAQSIPLEKWVADEGRIPAMEFERSGWMLIRAVADHPDTYRCVMTGPYYVQIGDDSAAQADSIQFFLDIAGRRLDQIRDSHSDQIRYHRATIKFWQQQLEMSQD